MMKDLIFNIKNVQEFYLSIFLLYIYLMDGPVSNDEEVVGKKRGRRQRTVHESVCIRFNSYIRAGKKISNASCTCYLLYIS